MHKIHVPGVGPLRLRVQSRSRTRWRIAVSIVVGGSLWPSRLLAASPGQRLYVGWVVWCDARPYVRSCLAVVCSLVSPFWLSYLWLLFGNQEPAKSCGQIKFWGFWSVSFEKVIACSGRFPERGELRLARCSGPRHGLPRNPGRPMGPATPHIQNRPLPHNTLMVVVRSLVGLRVGSGEIFGWMGEVAYVSGFGLKVPVPVRGFGC